MTDLEAYELLIKYCGGEKGLLMIREMIHVGGIEVAIKNTIKAAAIKGTPLNDDMKAWVRQSYEYVSKQMEIPNN